MVILVVLKFLGYIFLYTHIYIIFSPFSFFSYHGMHILYPRLAYFLIFWVAIYQHWSPKVWSYQLSLSSLKISSCVSFCCCQHWFKLWISLWNIHTEKNSSSILSFLLLFPTAVGCFIQVFALSHTWQVFIHFAHLKYIFVSPLETRMKQLNSEVLHIIKHEVHIEIFLLQSACPILSGELASAISEVRFVCQNIMWLIFLSPLSSCFVLMSLCLHIESWNLMDYESLMKENYWSHVLCSRWQHSISRRHYSGKKKLSL